MKYIFKTLIISTLFVTAAFAQEPQKTDLPTEPSIERMDFVQELELTQDQIQQIRVINHDNRAKRTDARSRVSDATRNLDQAIYADSIDELLVAQCLKELQEAQAEAAKVNFENEFAIRKILTTKQLVLFREIRQKFISDRLNVQRKFYERWKNRESQRPVSKQDRQDTTPTPKTN